jgi:hypothetical protein
MEIDGEGKVRIRIPWQVYAGLFVCVIVCIALIGLLYKEGSQPNIKISKDDVELQFPKEKSPPGAAIAATPAQTTPLNTPEDGKAVRGGPALRNRMAAWLRWILGLITPPISPRLLA